jgi:hypothetical protein
VKGNLLGKQGFLLALSTPSKSQNTSEGYSSTIWKYFTACLEF